MTGSSMRMFSAHLWKELRENRGALIGVFSVILVGCPALVFALHQFEVPMADLPTLAPILSVGLVAFALGGEVMGRELASDRRSAISRIPGGLLRPFMARLVIYVGAMVAAIVVGSLWTAVSMEVVADAIVTPRWLGHYGVILLAVAIGAFYPLAASCWLRQGMLAAPAGALLLGLLALPLMMRVHGGRILEILSDDLLLIACLWIAAGLLAAWVSFVRGLGPRGGRRGAAMCGISIILLGAIPVYGLAYDRVRDWSRLDIDDPSLLISGSSFLGADGNLLFVNTKNYGRGAKKPFHAAIVNLSDGSVRDLGPNTQWVPGAIAMGNGINLTSTAQSLARLYTFDGWRMHDGRTGKHLWSEHDELGAADSAMLRRTLFDASPVRLSDGRRAWAEAGGFFVGRPDDPGSLRKIGAKQFFFAAGHDGFRINYTNGSGDGSFDRAYYIAHTDQVIEVPPSPAWAVGVVGSEVLVKEVVRGRSTWQLIDQDGNTRPAPHLTNGDSVERLLSDGRAIVAVSTETTDEHERPVLSVALLDWETGQREALSFEDGSPVRVLSVWGNPGASTPAGRVIVHLTLMKKQVLAWLDPERLLLVRSQGSSIGRLIACVDEETAIVTTADSSQIVRVHFGEATEEVLFPR